MILYINARIVPKGESFLASFLPIFEGKTDFCKVPGWNPATNIKKAAGFGSFFYVIFNF